MLWPLLLASHAAAALALAQAASAPKVLEIEYTLSAHDPFVQVRPQPGARDAAAFPARAGLEVAVRVPLLGAQFSGRITGSAPNASLTLQTGRQRKYELAQQGSGTDSSLLIGDTADAAEGHGGTVLRTQFDGELVLADVVLTLGVVSERTALGQLETRELRFAAGGALAAGARFEGAWAVAAGSDGNGGLGEYARGTGDGGDGGDGGGGGVAVAIPLLRGTSFAVLTGAVGPDAGNYTAAGVPELSAQNTRAGAGVLWLGALDPGAQRVLRVRAPRALGLYALRQYGDSLADAETAPSGTASGTASGSASSTASESASVAAAAAGGDGGGGGGASVGGIVGGVVGGLAALLALVAGALLYRRSRRRARRGRPLEGPIDGPDGPAAAGADAGADADKPPADADADAYRAIVEDFVTPYTLGGGDAGAAARGATGKATAEAAAPVLRAPGTEAREADAGPLTETHDSLPPLYDPSWQSSSAGARTPTGTGTGK